MDKTTFPAMPETEATYIHCPACHVGLLELALDDDDRLHVGCSACKARIGLFHVYRLDNTSQ